MAVYTHLSSEEMASLIDAYEVGSLVSAKGIAEGVSNSNWLVETTGADGRGAKFVLTMYEQRTERSELPFFLGLLDHLATKGCAVPATMHDREGRAFRMLGDKAVALIEYLPGVSPDRPTANQAEAVGAALARVHLASGDYAGDRPNALDAARCLEILSDCGRDRLATIDPDLPSWIDAARRVVERWPSDLPRSIIHSDLFPDNVLMLGEAVTGLIDFYFACRDMMAYDVAVTHAAWCFARAGNGFDKDIGLVLLRGYESVRPLEDRERAALPLLAQGACLRFVASRSQDWLGTPEGALVMRKDPMEFVERWKFYADAGDQAFA